MSDAATDMIETIQALADASDSDSLKASLGDPSGTKIDLGGALRDPGAAWGATSVMQTIVTGIADWLKLEQSTIEDVDIGTLNDEQSVALGGDVAKHLSPWRLTVHLHTVTGGPNGDAIIRVGTSSGGNQILADTPLTGLDALNKTFNLDITGVMPAITADSTIYVKCTTADTGAAATTLINVLALCRVVD